MKKIYVFLLFSFTFSLPILGQIKVEQKNKIFAEVPLEYRSRLIERLNYFIDLEKNGKYDESYKMIAEAFKSRIEGRWKKEEYKEAQNIKIRKFSVTEISSNKDKTIIYVNQE